MARRPRRRLAVVLTTLAVTACTTATVGAPSTTISTSTTMSAPTTTTTTTPASGTSLAEALGIDAEVTVPVGDGPFPAVVVVHGGGWVAGSPDLIEPLADHLNENGFLTVNTRYALADFDRPGFPAAVEDIACAVRMPPDIPTRTAR